MEDKISGLEERNFEIIMLEENKEQKRSEETKYDLWGSIKTTHIIIIRIPEEEGGRNFM